MKVGGGQGRCGGEGGGYSKTARGRHESSYVTDISGQTLQR